MVIKNTNNIEADRKIFQDKISEILLKNYESFGNKNAIILPQGIGKTTAIYNNIKIIPGIINIVSCSTKNQADEHAKKLYNMGFKIISHLSFKDTLVEYQKVIENMDQNKWLEFTTKYDEMSNIIESLNLTEMINDEVYEMLNYNKIKYPSKSKIFSKIYFNKFQTSFKNIQADGTFEYFLFKYLIMIQLLSYTHDDCIHITTNQKISCDMKHVMRIVTNKKINLIMDEFDPQSFFTSHKYDISGGIDQWGRKTKNFKQLKDKQIELINEISKSANENYEINNIDGIFPIKRGLGKTDIFDFYMLTYNIFWNSPLLNITILTTERSAKKFFESFDFNIISSNMYINDSKLIIYGIKGYHKKELKNENTFYSIQGQKRYQAICEFALKELNIDRNLFIGNSLDGIMNLVETKGSNFALKYLNEQKNPKNCGIMINTPSSDKVTKIKMQNKYYYQKKYHLENKSEIYGDFNKYFNSNEVYDEIKEDVILDEFEQTVGRFSGFRSKYINNLNNIFVFVPSNLISTIEKSIYISNEIITATKLRQSNEITKDNEENLYHPKAKVRFIMRINKILSLEQNIEPSFNILHLRKSIRTANTIKKFNVCSASYNFFISCSEAVSYINFFIKNVYKKMVNIFIDNSIPRLSKFTILDKFLNNIDLMNKTKIKNRIYYMINFINGFKYHTV